MDRLLICGTNWLGDSIMSMPALQLLKQGASEVHVTLLVKPGMVPLWEMHEAVDAIVPIYQGGGGTRLTVRALKQQSFDRAVIFPNSFRSALLPFLGGVPRRIGIAAHWRRLLLTEPRPGRRPDDTSHQAWEYFRLLDLAISEEALAPRLSPPESARGEAEQLLAEDGSRPWVAMLPGAARGNSKRWPPESFAEVAKRLVDESGVRIALFGTAAERGACDHIADAVGDLARNLAGKTSLVVLAACLARCRAAVSNDSGGMHLATALGVPVVAVFGLTDPSLTGPLGAANRVICGGAPEERTRDVPRESAEAEAALRSVTPAQVLNDVRAMLEAL
ncbi:MAG: lipopolysaccharide heptosyltransferase II [Kiritimatiellae bacterium]|nr:lipopolysaccharide heptosyltransferase II [Kiritimatiellia bacterium]